MSLAPAQQPLLSTLEAEDWLKSRLEQHGIDLYAGGPYEHYRDRLAAAIVRNGIATVVVGRHAGKPENYQQCFERLYQQPLVPKAKRSPKATP